MDPFHANLRPSFYPWLSTSIPLVLPVLPSCSVYWLYFVFYCVLHYMTWETAAHISLYFQHMLPRSTEVWSILLSVIKCERSALIEKLVCILCLVWSIDACTVCLLCQVHFLCKQLPLYNCLGGHCCNRPPYLTKIYYLLELVSNHAHTCISQTKWKSICQKCFICNYVYSVSSTISLQRCTPASHFLYLS